MNINSIQIIEDSDNRRSDNQGSTVCHCVKLVVLITAVVYFLVPILKQQHNLSLYLHVIS